MPPLEAEGAVTSVAKAVVANAEDGSVLVREVRERKVKTREEIEEVKETEDVVHLGDITDEGYIAAVLENKDIRTAAVDSKALASTGPRLVRQSARGHRVVDTEDTEEASVATPDGRLLTETKTQHQHEVEDMEEDDDEGGKDIPDETIEGEGKKHKFVRTKEEEIVSYLADGVKIAEEMKYRAENFEGEKEGGDETDAPRLRGLKSKASRGAPPASPANGERKDALTRRPLDLDAEEETRKVETSKWLEHHFGSDSRSSREGSAGGFDDPESPFYGGVTPGGGSYIGVTMTSRPNAVKQDVPVTREPLNTSPLPHTPVNNSFTRIKTPEPYTQPITNGIHHETETTEIRKESVKTTGSSIIGRKDVIQVLPTGPGRTFRPPKGSAVPPPPTTELSHVEPQKRKKRPPPQPLWTSDVTEDEERMNWSKEREATNGTRPWSPENDNRTAGRLGDDIGRSANHISQQLRQSTVSSPSDHSWNRVEEATVSWTNGVNGNHVMTNGDHLHDNHLRLPSPVPPPQEGVRVARTRRRAPPIPTQVETNGIRSSETPTPPMAPEKKHPIQKTRFADEEGEEYDEEMGGHSEGHIRDDGKEKKKKRVKKKKSGSFGDSIRRLMGRLRSRSSEKKRGKDEQGKQIQHQKPSANSARRGSWRSSSRTPSPDEYCEPTYRRYQNAIDGNIRVSKQERTHHNHQRNHRSVGVPRGPEYSPNEATSGEEYEEEEHNVGFEGRGMGGGGPVAPPRARPTVVSQGHSVTQHRSGAESQHRHHHHGGSSRQQQVSSTHRPPSPVGRHNESSRNEDRSWRESSSRRRDYAAEASSGVWSSSSRRRHAYSPERGSAGAPFSSTTSEGDSSRRRESDRVPPVLATSTPMDYDKRHGGIRAREESGNHVQRFYLGEDPFGGSIYGREREYEGVKRSSRQRHEEHKKSGLRYG
ncbi:hypothetical protein J437_LFUL013192 [Ladona fulva]|uniref:Uncharacterized protein n=1 Tax=Ladona fulva TaxID=123851 RepID=A0A8K0KC94_LADFU|nr:hypothetical protein J437_LFUL013192 [Ladona fulva]